MEAFTRVTGIAAPLLHANIDTDLIIPSREITHPGKQGFGERLLAPWRYLPSSDGQRVENPDFVLNRAPFRQAVILIAGENFGSGSSREAAVWAIRQFGLRCVIAPSFGAIFASNCVRNGVLPVVLPIAEVEALGAEAMSGALSLTVDLGDCTVSSGDTRRWSFHIGDGERNMMLEGLDAIGVTLNLHAEIDAFAHADRALRPWQWLR